MQDEPKASAVFVSRPHQSATFSIVHKFGSALTGLKCFLASCLWQSIHLINLVFSHQTINKCPHSWSLVIKQTDNILLAILLATQKCYKMWSKQYCIFCSVLYFLKAVLCGNNSTHIRLIFTHASVLIVHIWATNWN